MSQSRAAYHALGTGLKNQRRLRLFIQYDYYSKKIDEWQCSLSLPSTHTSLGEGGSVVRLTFGENLPAKNIVILAVY